MLPVFVYVTYQAEAWLRQEECWAHVQNWTTAFSPLMDFHLDHSSESITELNYIPLSNKQHTLPWKHCLCERTYPESELGGQHNLLLTWSL